MEESVHKQLRMAKRNTPVESFDVTSLPNDNCEDSLIPSATMSGAYSNGSDLKHISDEPIGESQECFKGDVTPNLENLPAELRTQLLLSMPDLPTLRALIHTSPTMHTQYRYDRDHVLWTCLERELSGFLIDAYANMMSRVCELGSPRTDEKITSFLDTYRAWLSGASPLPDLQSIDSGYIHWMAAYHISVACPLARMYSSWALDNIKKTVSSSVARNGTETLPIAQDSRGVNLSRSEEIRIFRALYRYETYHHLFGRNKGRRHGGFRHHEINEIFFSQFAPWEAEAVGCVDIFIRQKYKDIFSDVKEDLHPQNARFRLENGTFNPEGSFNLDGEYDDYMDGTVSRGLKMAVRLLNIGDHEKLVSKMQRCLTHDQNLDAPVRTAIGLAAQSDRREMSTSFPNKRDEAEQRQDPIRFTGDTVPPNGPPLAWVLLWGGKYANIYGEYVPESLRRWGYVIWDKIRWDSMEAKELIARQWEMEPELVEEIKMDIGWSPLESGSVTIEHK
ncbi:hypothetical protein V8C40DRAFT_234572 [Trichoderma camerunense]